MAVIPFSLVDSGQTVVGDPTVVYSWSPMTQIGADTGQPLSGMGWSDRSFQAEGTFGAGGSITVEGSNDGVNWHILHDPFSVPISITVGGLTQVTEISRFIRPRVVGGDATTSLTVTGVFRTQRIT